MGQGQRKCRKRRGGVGRRTNRMRRTRRKRIRIRRRIIRMMKSKIRKRKSRRNRRKKMEGVKGLEEEQSLINEISVLATSHFLSLSIRGQVVRTVSVCLHLKSCLLEPLKFI